MSPGVSWYRPDNGEPAYDEQDIGGMTLEEIAAWVDQEEQRNVTEG